MGKHPVRAKSAKVCVKWITSEDEPSTERDGDTMRAAQRIYNWQRKCDQRRCVG